MAVENAQKLLAKLREDSALANRFRAAGTAGFEGLAREQGFTCTVGEMRSAITDAQASTELSDKELEGVAGAAAVVLLIQGVVVV